MKPGFSEQLPGSSPKIISFIPTGVYDLYYQPQAKYLVYNRDVDGDDSFQFYLYDIAARESTLITDGSQETLSPYGLTPATGSFTLPRRLNGNGVDLSVINPFDS